MAVGDLVWRGYARKFDDDKFYPEIRPGNIVDVDADGSLTVNMIGRMPGSEGKRSPGQWRAWGQPPERYHATPQAALEDAISAVETAQ